MSSTCFRPLHAFQENTLGHKTLAVKSSNKFTSNLQSDSGRLCCGFLNTRFFLVPVASLADGVHIVVRNTAIDGVLLAGQDGGRQAQPSSN